MPYFPTQDDIYRVIERELPFGVYLDGPPTAGYTTADNYSIALTIANIYLDLQSIYLNYFPQTTDNRINDWEIKVFGVGGNPMLTLDQRRTLVINKIRSQPNLSIWQILTTVVQFLPPGIYAQIVEWNCMSATSWTLGVSKLSSETILGWADNVELNNPLGLPLCQEIANGPGWRIGQSALSVSTQLTGDNSWQTISKLQAKAYTYEVRIFGYTLTGSQLQNMLTAITNAEPARSTHVVQQNLSLTQFGLVVPVTNVSQTSGINCITLDPTSTTGYSGLTTLGGP